MDQLLAGLNRLKTNRRRFLAGSAAAFGAALLPTAARAQTPDDVLIIGGGLAGLNAALILASQGANVTVLEADSRPGGRIRTLDGAEGRPEAGGSEVGPLYARTRSLAADFGLALYTPSRPPSGMALHLQNRLISPKQWITDAENHLPDDLRTLPPYAVETALMARATPLAAPEDWLTPEAARRDQPYSQLLNQLGGNDQALAYAALSAQSDSLAETSALWMLRRDQSRRQSANLGPVEHIKGGMSRLTDAMAAKLGDNVHLNTRVRALSQDSSGVTAHTYDGKTFKAARAILTLPASVTRTILFDPLPLTAQAAAWAALPYGQATSAFFPIIAPFWEEDGLPPSTWSDSLPGRGLVMANDQGAFLWFYATNNRANAFHKASLADIPAMALAQLTAARPSVKGRLGPGSAFSWANNPLALGTFASRRPGYLAPLQKLLQREHGRISFAGEHTADLASGIEGALESGERAAIAMLI